MEKMINLMIKLQNTVIWVASIFYIVLGQERNYNNFQEGLSLERSGKIEEAIIIYKEILNNSPDHQPSFFQLKNNASGPTELARSS